MQRTMVVLVSAVVMGVVTLLVGWWGPLLCAVLWRRPALSALGAMLGWGGLLAWQASRGEVGVLAEQVGGVLSLPATALPVLTVAFAGLLAWSGAAVAHTLLGQRSGTA